MSHPPIQITDENDQPLRGGTMDEAQLQGLWHRVVGVMVQDRASGEFLLQKVAPNPFYSGGRWTLTSTGHVDAGEEYEEAAARELFEEMGIQGVELNDFSYYQSEREDFRAGKNRTYRRHNKVFIAYADKTTLNVTPQPGEVEDWTWMSLEKLRDESVPKSKMLERFMEDWAKRS